MRKTLLALAIALLLLIPRTTDAGSGCETCTSIKTSSGDLRAACAPPADGEWGYELCEIRLLPKRGEWFYCVLTGYQCLYIEVR